MEMMMDLFNVLDSVNICGQLAPVMRIVGYVILAIKIIVPIILIIVGMIDMTKAVMSKKDDEIKDAQKGFMKKAIAAICVFLVMTIVTLLMTLVGDDSWQGCAKCINDPGSCSAPSTDVPTK